MVRDVRVAIDMNRTDDSLIERDDEETLRLNDVIMAKLTEGLRLVEREAPLRMLESGHDFGNEDDVFLNADGTGYVILPHDFMRLIRFRMSDWRRPVDHAITEDDAAYGAQSSRWAGVRGCPEKPVAAIVRRSEGKVLEFWGSADGTATLTQAAYQPYPVITEQGMIDVPEECYRAAVYRAGALALATTGDPLWQTLLEISKSLLRE